MELSAILLAAGKGVRMNSSLPKVLHCLLGRPMIQYGVEALRQVTGQPPVVVVGSGAEAVQAAVGDAARFVLQPQQLGTAHAVGCAASVLRGKAGLVLVAYADMPLLRAETFQKLIEVQQTQGGAFTLLTLTADDPRGFGRIVRQANGSVTAIVEESVATPEQKAIRELNAGVYCFDSAWLWEALEKVQVSARGEYYLTDLVEIAVAQGRTVNAMSLSDPCEAIGINTRLHLAEAEAALRQRINTAHMLAGVTMIDPAATYIEPSVKIGRDTILYPGTYLRGNTIIGEGCQIGPNTIIEDTSVAENCHILASVLEGAMVEKGVGMGPFCHLRKGAHLAEGVHMGNFGEVKSSYLGPGVKMGHFSYIGDATIGANVNIGAGTITCNFDGVHKNKTEIGADVFIGSDTMLVAPVTLGEGARTGAGSVVTHDVPAHTLVVGVPARELRKLEKYE